MGGIEAGTLLTLAGISGSGKSSIVNTLETDLIDNNPTQNLVVLSFNFEMSEAKTVGRKISYKTRKTATELYSGSDEHTLTEKDISEIKAVSERIKGYPVYYCPEPGTVTQIYSKIIQFQNYFKNKWIIIILDHALLVRQSTGGERATLDELQRILIERKKIGRTSIIQVAQMNRNIESPERISNRMHHYPQRNDIFGSDSLYFASDYVIISHCPQILGITEYGPSRLPADKIYLHILKNRDGEPRILQFENNLKYNSIDET